ncbi:ABC transporter permease [Nitrosococcus halophilus]|uniref:ABC transporter permease n=1 Tax=Nitrosococcus halophilus TaxID=133539 RepID=UPI0002E017B7
MNEAERCDRISLMHAGQVLASDSPSALKQRRGVETLEEAFIVYLEEATGLAENLKDNTMAGVIPQSPPKKPPRATAFSLRRLLGYARRESLEIKRDPIRLLFALVGSVLLMFTLGYGMTFDVEDLKFAALDWDQTPASRDYLHNVAGSRYFIKRPPIHDYTELEQRMKSGELSLAIEIPPNFGKDLKRGRAPEIGVWIDGAMPFRGETIRGYVEGLHYQYLTDLAIRTYGIEPRPIPADLEIRYRYNQDFKSLYAMMPAMIPVLLVFIPAMLVALGVVREKELGSITNLYVTPVTRLEFLLGKQLPYIGVSMISFFGLVVLAVFLFEVPLKGSFAALTAGALLYVTATTGFGLLMSTFAQTQIAALAGTAIVSLLAAVNFSGLTDPVSSLEGVGAWIGQLFPTTYFLIISRGTFTKALDFSDLYPYFIALAAFIPVFTLLSLIFLRKQEK